MGRQLIMAESAASAADLKCENAVFLAGGTEINRLGSEIRADKLIGLKRASDLKGITVTEDVIRIGAGNTFQEAMEMEEVPAYLKEALEFMASRTKRNMATLGGNVASRRSDSYLLPTLLAAKAQLELLEAAGTCETICIETYLREPEAYQNSLITAILLPKDGRCIRNKRYANTAESHAMLTVSMGSSGLSDISIAAAVKNAGIFDLSALAVDIEADPDMTEEEILAWADKWQEADLKDDMFGSAAFKRYRLGITISLMLEQLRKGGIR